MGVAGSGKTTTLAAVREGFESAGYTVLGTATSGQAARNLGEGAGSSRGPSPRSPGDWTTTPWSSPTATSDPRRGRHDLGCRSRPAPHRRRAIGGKADHRRRRPPARRHRPRWSLTALAERHPEHLGRSPTTSHERPAEVVALVSSETATSPQPSPGARNGRVHSVPDRRRAVTP